MNFSGKWVELEKIILIEVTQTQKDKCHTFFFPHEAPISKSSAVSSYPGVTAETKKIKRDHCWGGSGEHREENSGVQVT